MHDRARRGSSMASQLCRKCEGYHVGIEVVDKEKEKASGHVMLCRACVQWSQACLLTACLTDAGTSPEAVPTSSAPLTEATTRSKAHTNSSYITYMCVHIREVELAQTHAVPAARLALRFTAQPVLTKRTWITAELHVQREASPGLPIDSANAEGIAPCPCRRSADLQHDVLLRRVSRSATDRHTRMATCSYLYVQIHARGLLIAGETMHVHGLFHGPAWIAS
jgi:hypothetical protein